MNVTTPNDQDVLDDCLDHAGGAVYLALGYTDEDLEQEACEAMIIASRSYEPDHGCSLRTWLMQKAKWRAIECYREITGSRHAVQATEVPLSSYDDLGVNDPGYSAVTETVDNAVTLTPATIAHAIVGCSARDRSVITGYLCGEDGVTASARVGVSESRISQIVHRFRERFVAQAGGHR